MSRRIFACLDLMRRFLMVWRYLFGVTSRQWDAAMLPNDEFSRRPGG